MARKRGFPLWGSHIKKKKKKNKVSTASALLHRIVKRCKDVVLQVINKYSHSWIADTFFCSIFKLEKCKPYKFDRQLDCNKRTKQLFLLKKMVEKHCMLRSNYQPSLKIGSGVYFIKLKLHLWHFKHHFLAIKMPFFGIKY